MDFFSAIQSGIQKSDEVKRSHSEVKKVLDQVSEAINKHTKGQLRLIRTIYSQRSDPFLISIPSGLTTWETYFRKKGRVSVAGLAEDRLPEKIEQPNALILVHPTQRASYRKIFAKWFQDPLGYPCVITSYYGFEYVCSSKDELDSAFYAMLTHPEFNELIRSAIQNPRHGFDGRVMGPGF